MFVAHGMTGKLRIEINEFTTDGLVAYHTYLYVHLTCLWALDLTDVVLDD